MGTVAESKVNSSNYINNRGGCLYLFFALDATYIMNIRKGISKKKITGTIQVYFIYTASAMCNYLYASIAYTAIKNTPIESCKLINPDIIKPHMAKAPHISNNCLVVK